MIRFVLGSLLSLAVAFGQIGTSTISGRVVDSSGAVIPNVAITVVQPQTNFTFSAVTNNEGLYRVQSLQPGMYRVTFEAQGFRRLLRDNVELRTGDTLAVDGILEVGNVAESIEVSAATQLLETQTSASGAVVSGKVMYDLPFFQRYVNWSVTLVPGVMTNGNPHPNSPGGWSVAGQRGATTALFEDGVHGNAQVGNAVIKPVLNTVAEVKVLTTTLPAEYGHSAGGVISVVKKTGTNEFHGMLSEFGRSRRMQHRRFFDRDRTSTPQPGRPNGVPTYFLLPDANVSGPVYIPKIYDGRNKTFFVFGWQRLQEKKIQQIITSAVPTDAMKQGDFSFNGLGNPLYDPSSTTRNPDGTWSRALFPNFRVPLNRFDPVARKVLDLNPWAASNTPGTLNANGPVGNHIADEAALVIFDDFSYRIDHQFNSGFKLYGTLTENRQFEPGRPHNLVNRDFDGSAGQITNTGQKNFSFGPTWVISPTIVNDARFGYYLRRQKRDVPSFGKNYGQILGIPGLSPDLMPGLGNGNRYTAESIYGISGDGPQRQAYETLSFRNDLSIIKGTHAFKMGYEVLRFRLNSTLTNRPSGQFFFDGVTAGLLPDGNLAQRTGNTFAGFLTGAVRRAFFDAELTSWLPRSSINSFYFQDDWKFSPTLTMNLGVRYSNETPFTTKYGLMSNFDPTAIDDLTGRTGAIIHPKNPLNRRDTNNFQPRVGLAWHPLQKWVFRGGFAVNTIDVKYPAARIQFEEYVALNNQERAPGDPRPIYQISRGPDPITFNIRPDGSAPIVGTNFSARTADLWDPKMRNPYSMNWNATIQYELITDYLLEFSYQGSTGVGLAERWETNTFPIDAGANNPALRAEIFRVPQNFRPYSHFGSVFMRSNFGHSTFHAATVKLDKRFSQGLLFSTFYTFGKAIDSQDSDNDGSGVAPIQNRSLEKGLAGYNRSHRYVGILTYELPTGQGKRFLNRGGVWNKVFGGYSIGWVQYAESGNPLTFSFTNPPAGLNYYPTFAGNRRPDLVSTPKLRDNWSDFGGDRFNAQNINPVIDIGHFAYPAAFQVGNSGRNIVTGMRLLTSNVSAQKNTKLGERINLLLRWDYQNAFHTFNFNAPSTAVDLQNPRTFAKVTGDITTTAIGAQPLMHLTLALSW